MEWTSIDVFSKLSLTCAGKFSYYESVHHPIPTLTVQLCHGHSRNRMMLNNFTIFKTNQSALLSIEYPGVISFWPTKGEKKAFVGGCNKEGEGKG